MTSRSTEQQPQEIEAPAGKKVSKVRAKPKVYRDLDGHPLFEIEPGKANPTEFNVSKFHVDVLSYWHAAHTETRPVGKQQKETDVIVTAFDPDEPMADSPLQPGPLSPICAKCGLDRFGCHNPYMSYRGSENPLITIVLDGLTVGDDDRNSVATNGQAAYLERIIRKHSEVTGVQYEDIRWIVMTRCASRNKAGLNLKPKANWCRHHVVDDLMRHRPRLVVPVGTTVLGLLSHKSSAQEWSGKLLTYRGWPDDWLTNPLYALPRPDPRDPTKTVTGHPVFGKVPDWRIPMIPLQQPMLIAMERNKQSSNKYDASFVRALKLAKQGVEPLNYSRDWYDFSDDPDHVEQVLTSLLQYPGLEICYDTETTGLKPWYTTWEKGDDAMVCAIADARIVSIMLRWTDPETGYPASIGFPWDAETWQMKASIKRIKPLVWKVLTQSTLIGHNLTFDMLYTWATLNTAYTHGSKSGWDDPELNKKRDARMSALADACKYDTWHMAFAHAQKRGSLGLEALASQWVPDLAGYEEDFTLLIDLHYEDMHPAAGKGGHYLNCPKDTGMSALRNYVMGDVEVAYRAYERLKDGLDTDQVYDIPLADPARPGQFRAFPTHDRRWIYEHIMSPASRVLMKMMARGMYVDQQELQNQVELMPKQIVALRDELASINPIIGDYVAEMRATEGPGWDLDLENKSQLKELLFHRMNLPVLRLTKAGKKKFGDDINEAKEKLKAAVLRAKPELRKNPKKVEATVEQYLYDYAAVDKFTLNKLTVQVENLRPLRKYRQAFKLYSTYVRPLQNVHTSVDKKARKSDAHLCFDSCVHASFQLTGTRGGRLSCSNPNLQQLPRDGKVKSLFVSRFGERGCIYQGDLSQIELRLLAAASGDPTMVKAYFDDVDLHTLTASRIFSKPYEDFTKENMKRLQEAKRDDLAKELDTMRNVAKCVDPYSLVSVNGRIVRIGSLKPGPVEPDTFYDLPADTSVQTVSGTCTATQFYSNGTGKRLMVCSRRGIVVCSETHRLRLANGKLVKAVELKKGQILEDVTPLDCRDNEAIGIKFNPHSIQIEASNYCINVDSKFAYFLGLFYGDGSSREGLVSITTGGSPEYFAWQDQIAEVVNGLGFVADIKRTLWSDETGSSGAVVFGSRRVQDILLQLGAVDSTEKRSRTLQIPEWLFNSAADVKLSFLGGLSDTDGTVAADGSVSVTTKSWIFAQDICVLARSVGLLNTLEPMWNKKYKRYYYRIHFVCRTAWTHLKSSMRRQDKIALMRKPKFVYKNERPNEIKEIIALDDGPLVDISVDNPDRLYRVNGFVCHNTVNFLTGYGGGAFGLQNVLAMKDIDKPIEECEEIIALFFDSYPAIKKLLSYYKRFIEDNACAVSIFGRVRYFDEVYSEDGELRSKALRAGCNHLIQSTASDMMITALFCIETLMREANLESILVSTVHDSLLIDAVRAELPAIHQIVTDVLNNFPDVFKMVYGDDFDTSWMIVPFTGDCEVGTSYLSVKKIPSKSTNKIDWEALLAD